ncbi:MAG: hypothetical protein CVV64_09115 [Candidatus Wallbacteria bacterium HGW-Wallbacteria-1]|jgi:uncharacterized membrane protein|uniref:Heptaprenyl diphosphate synthase n=1 Tax=Candidatus Wallbacteria bacterium HGW-Wallbacteria-1 TaxID=2013854 RepID=A0A2N1PQ99_9BACT|nr:MAG: hypothetical protein CVV64_09115 [Candidatus Wallbacteria bacterium HGW-Wallbacteria-1]
MTELVKWDMIWMGLLTEMKSPADSKHRNIAPCSRSISLLLAVSGLLAAGAMALSLIERGFPRPLPWARPGLGNSMVLASFRISGSVAAAGVALAKVFCSSLVNGGIGGPSFFMALAGTAAAYCVMAILGRVNSPLSEIGVSVASAFAHSMAQLGVITVSLADTGVFWTQAGPMVLFSIIAGYITGVLARIAIGTIERALDRRENDHE